MGIMASIQDRVLLLLSIKEEGKKIDFEHIMEKICRDLKTKAEDIVNELKHCLDALVKEGLIIEERGNYAISEKGEKEILERIKVAGDELNLSYRMVLKAKKYYPKVVEAILPFLRDRAVSVIKVFSDEAEPANKIKSLFVRYARYKPKPVYIEIGDVKTLLKYVDQHAIDFIPYVHKIDAREPEWFILDLDIGEELRKHPRSFELLKIVAEKTFEVLEENEIEPCIKFSGSRGIQIWAKLDNSKLRSEGELFAVYRNLAVNVQQKTEQKLQENKLRNLIKPSKPITTSQVAKKEERADQILIDWSSMKPSGDVRAPFSMHYKTALISTPISKERLLQFEIEEAQPENVVANLAKLTAAFKLQTSNPIKLLRN
jgi:DNA primase